MVLTEPNPGDPDSEASKSGDDDNMDIASRWLLYMSTGGPLYAANLEKSSCKASIETYMPEKLMGLKFMSKIVEVFFMQIKLGLGNQSTMKCEGFITDQEIFEW